LPTKLGPIFSGIFFCLQKVAIVEELLITSCIIEIPTSRYEAKVGDMIYQFFLLVCGESALTNIVNQCTGKLMKGLGSFMRILCIENIFTELRSELRISI
jgi:hypothetical protein